MQRKEVVLFPLRLLFDLFSGPPSFAHSHSFKIFLLLEDLSLHLLPLLFHRQIPLLFSSNDLLGIEVPASSPYVTAVGASMGPETGKPEVVCSSDRGSVITSGGGFSKFFQRYVAGLGGRKEREKMMKREG